MCHLPCSLLFSRILCYYSGLYVDNIPNMKFTILIIQPYSGVKYIHIVLQPSPQLFHHPNTKNILYLGSFQQSLTICGYWMWNPSSLCPELRAPHIPTDSAEVFLLCYSRPALHQSCPPQIHMSCQLLAPQNLVTGSIKK